jgi:hypothetical protein
MKHTLMLVAFAVLLGALVQGTSPARPQYQPNGDANGSSVSPDEVSAGTRFLIRLDNVVSTKDGKAGDRFRARTIEPLATAGGTVLPAGAEISGHVDKVEPAHKTGRAKLWLTFDDIRTPNGWLPVVAMVDDAPGIHSVRVDYNREGEIEANASKHQEEMEAAAAGAFVGAATGIAAGKGKDAAIGAATGAATAFMAVSGLGQELTLDKGTKLELILERSLYFRQT